MPRPLRIEYEGAFYHVLSRGDRREDIFCDHRDRARFLELLGRCSARMGWEVHAYCLMSNHFHLVVETPRANLSAGMKWLLGTYTMGFNRRHRLGGHLFGGRYKALLLDEGDPSYLRDAGDYVHLNPARAGLVGPEDPLEHYPWSSYPAYLTGKAPSWLRCDRLLGEHGLQTQARRERREFAARTEQRRWPEDHGPELPQRGWFYGAEDFLTRVLDRLEKEAKPRQRGLIEKTTDLEIAERIVQAGLSEFKLEEKELLAMRKGDERKVLLARRVRAGSGADLKWTAQRLAMGSWSNVSNLLAKKCKK